VSKFLGSTTFFSHISSQIINGFLVFEAQAIADIASNWTGLQARYPVPTLKVKNPVGSVKV
jgi:hypothetical protein